MLRSVGGRQRRQALVAIEHIIGLMMCIATGRRRSASSVELVVIGLGVGSNRALRQLMVQEGFYSNRTDFISTAIRTGCLHDHETRADSRSKA